MPTDAHPTARRSRRRGVGSSLRSSLRAAVAVLGVATALVAAGCSVPESDDTPFSQQLTPVVPTETTPPPQPGSGTDTMPGPCPDPDPMVIATCLQGTGTVMVADPQTPSGIVADRVTGELKQVSRSTLPKVITTFDVDSSRGGGLVAFAFAPTYAEDHIVYALITTGSDMRVVSQAPGDVAKPILSGIPLVPGNNNQGDLAFNTNGDLLVVTPGPGTGGLSGKVLLLRATAAGFAAPTTVMSGLGGMPAVCGDGADGTVYLTDRSAAADRLQSLNLSTKATRVIWSWPTKPGLAGCAVSNGRIYLPETKAKSIETIAAPTAERPNPDKPEAIPTMTNRYGAYGRITASGPTILVATTNKLNGRPGKTDDRVIRVPGGAAPVEDLD